MKIENCKVNHLINPCGFEIEGPVFSFLVKETEGKNLAWAEITVSDNPEMKHILAATGRRVLDFTGEKLSFAVQPRTRYYWRVSACTDAGEMAESDVQWFETGKLDEPWRGLWITCTDEDMEQSDPVFSKSFSVSGEVISARLYISGLGMFEARLNGNKISDEYLTPYCTDYENTVQYMTFDLTDQISENNTISVELADGWYKGRFGFDQRNDKGYYGSSRKMIAELYLRYADGREEIIASDDTWEVHRGSIRFSSIYDGEHRDDTCQKKKETAMILSEEESGKLHLCARRSLPVRVMEILEPAELIHTPAGETVIDLGQNIAGIFRLRVHEPAGKEIHLQFGEVLQNGNFYRDNLRTAKAEYIYVSDGEEHILEPKFTYYGYRYAKIEGIDTLDPSDFQGLVLYSDIETVGKLETGDEKMNRLIANIQWGQKGNFIDVPTDCPQRDERMGWTGDTQVFAPTACYFTDSYAFYAKYLADLRTEQKKLNGKIPNVIPSFGITDTSSVWGDVAVILPWTLYLYYGDISVLEESFDSMKAWVDYITGTDGETHHWREVFHFGDWLALDHPQRTKDQVKGGTDEGYIADVYYMYSASLTAKAAKILKKEDDAAKYAALSEKIRSGIEEEFFTARGRCAVNTQTAYVLALKHHLSSDPGKILGMLKQLLKYSDGKLQTGFTGTPLLLPVLSEYEEDRTAYEILHNEEYPGWLYEVNLGATTVWERWNSMEADGSVSSTGMNSFNHYSYGSVGEWMWKTVAGISPCEDAPGFRRVMLRPVPDYDLKEAHASFRSPSGMYETAWKVIDVNHISLDVTVPFGCSAVLELPYSRKEPVELTAGTYAFCYETDVPLKTILSVNDTLKTLLDDSKAKKVLMEKMPQISMMPERMRNVPLKMLLGQNEQSKALIPVLDSLLRSL